MPTEEIAYAAVAPLPAGFAALVYERSLRLAAALGDRNAEVAIDESTALSHKLADRAGLESLHAALQDLAVSGIGSIQDVRRVQELLDDVLAHLRKRLVN